MRFILCFTCTFILTSHLAHADLLLTGLLQHGTSPGQNGQTAGSPIWNTLGNEVSFANIYLTQPNGGYTAPLLNTGNGSGTSISYSLSPGTYSFYFFVMGFWDNNPGEYGLNLFFGGDNTNPGIAAYSAAGLSGANAAMSGIGTLALSGSPTGVTPSPSNLIYTSGGLSVTLTDYGFGNPGIFGGTALDRVGNLNSNPDLALDSVGRFTLSVTSVPEPSMACMTSITILIIAFRKMRSC